MQLYLSVMPIHLFPARNLDIYCAAFKSTSSQDLLILKILHFSVQSVFLTFYKFKYWKQGMMLNWIPSIFLSLSFLKIKARELWYQGLSPSGYICSVLVLIHGGIRQSHLLPSGVCINMDILSIDWGLCCVPIGSKYRNINSGHWEMKKIKVLMTENLDFCLLLLLFWICLHFIVLRAEIYIDTCDL